MDSRTKHQRRLDEIHVIKMNALEDVWKQVRNKQDYSDSLFVLYHCQLMEFEDTVLNLNHVKVKGGRKGSLCSECQKLIGNVYKLNDELRESTLPNKNCKNEIGKVEVYDFCLLYYESVFDDEL